MIKLKELEHNIKAALKIPYAFALALYISILMILFGDPSGEED